MIRQDWSSLKKLLFFQMAAGGGAAVERTATGNPLTFVTDLARPLKSLLIPFTTQQEGTGDPSPENIRSILPWNGLTVFGGGKNLLNPATIRKQGNDNLWWYEQDGLFLPAGTYCFTFARIMTGFYVIDANTGTNLRSKYNSATDKFTLTEDHFIKINVYVSGGVEVEEEAMLEAGQTATAYEPYHPITETDIVFPALGKNLLPESAVEYGSYGTDGGKIQNDNNKYRRLSIDLPAGNYVFSTDTPNCYFIRLLVDDVVSGTGGAIQSKSFTLSNPANVKIAWRNTDTSAITETLHNQIETGSTPTAYEPFDNAVYGGTLDVVSGVLTVEWKYISLKGLSFFKYVGYMYAVGLTDKDLRGGICSDYFTPVKRNAQADGEIGYYDNGAGYAGNVYIYKSGAETAEDFNTWLNELEYDPHIAYKLATPQEIQLTPTQLTALIGNNTIWSDADGSMTAVYLKKG